ncbi:MAG: metallophosphoesterase family protein [Ktedonobacteraceae bacterium]|nr:metallophosphoesterase family protein [Ktedonobacteraceae bacterium]
MRVAIISDIHGNQVALEAVLDDLAQQPAIDQCIIAGDLCLNGPCPRQVLETVQRLGCPVIKGNVDEEVVTKAPEKSEKKRNTISWTREQIGQVGINYLHGLPTSHRISSTGGSDLLIVHANPLNMEEAIFPNASDSTLEHFMGGLEPAIGAVAFGHLHIAYVRRWRHLLLVDVASCGIPRDEDLRAAYGILTWRENTWEAEIRRVEYNVTTVVKQIKTSGMPNGEKRVKILLEARY